MKVYILSRYSVYEGDTIIKIWHKFPSLKDLQCVRLPHSEECLSYDHLCKLMSDPDKRIESEGYVITCFEVKEN